MKCIILTVLACVIALEAKPQPLLGLGNIGLGLGSGIGAGLGSGLGAGLGAGVGLGVGVVNLANGLVTGLVPGLVGGLGQGLGIGLGIGGRGAGFAQGGSGAAQGGAAAGSDLNAGANGLDNQGSQKAGAGNLQDAAQNQNNLPSVPQDVSSASNQAVVNAGAQAGIGSNPDKRSPIDNGIGNGQQMI